jgi:hypothetical protein
VKTEKFEYLSEDGKTVTAVEVTHGLLVPDPHKHARLTKVLRREDYDLKRATEPLDDDNLRLAILYGLVRLF